MRSSASRYNMEHFFQALGDTTRLRLLNLMAEKEICVCYFVEILGHGQPKISRHLAYLRRAGLVSARREGKWMHYRTALPPHPGAVGILRQTFAWLKQDTAMRADREKLSRLCCAPQKLTAIPGAPLPAACAAPLRGKR